MDLENCIEKNREILYVWVRMCYLDGRKQDYLT